MRKIDVRDGSMKTNILAIVTMFLLVFSLAACVPPPVPIAGSQTNASAESTLVVKTRSRLIVAGPSLTEILDADV